MHRVQHQQPQQPVATRTAPLPRNAVIQAGGVTLTLPWQTSMTSPSSATSRARTCGVCTGLRSAHCERIKHEEDRECALKSWMVAQAHQPRTCARATGTRFAYVRNGAFRTQIRTKEPAAAALRSCRRRARRWFSAVLTLNGSQCGKKLAPISQLRSSSTELAKQLKYEGGGERVKGAPGGPTLPSERVAFASYSPWPPNQVGAPCFLPCSRHTEKRRCAPLSPPSPSLCVRRARPRSPLSSRLPRDSVTSPRLPSRIHATASLRSLRKKKRRSENTTAKSGPPTPPCPPPGPGPAGRPPSRSAR